MGVYSGRVLELAAEALRLLGTTRAFVVHSADGTDEVSLSAPTDVVQVSAEGTRRFRITPEEIGVRPAAQGALRGGDPAQNAASLLGILRGEKSAAREGVLANAAFALQACDLAQDPREGAALAGKTIDSGAAMNLLETLRSENQA
jgi:anthranilate phosphoribosyltransferase